ncbi:MAG: class I SAM-dependent methyltransferase [Limisphaerales bacterium]
MRGQVLEVGAGIGQITGMLLQRPAITRLVSIEPDPNFCRRFRATFPAHEIVEGTVDDLKGEEAWNAILSVNVLEHIETDERELAVYRQKLAHEKGCPLPVCPRPPGNLCAD